jgi:hypothetical protein
MTEAKSPGILFPGVWVFVLFLILILLFVGF